MDEKIIKNLQFTTSKYKIEDINNVINLYLEGNTIPFMARYRKEATNNKTEVEIKEIIDAYELALKFVKRKEYIKSELIKKEIWSEVIEKEFNLIKTLNTLETWYAPYKEKKTRKYEKAQTLGIAEKVEKIINKEEKDVDTKITQILNHYSNSNGLEIEEVKELVIESIKEVIVKNPTVRKSVKDLYSSKSFITTKVVDESKDINGKYKLYYNFNSEYTKVKGHQLLAIEKAVNDGVIKVSYKIEKDNVLKEVSKTQFYKIVSNELLKEAVKNVYTTRIKKSVETELYKELKITAENEAIEIFKENLSQLLMATPIKDKIIMAIDPAYRSGCKIAIIDEQGNSLKIEVIYPHAPQNDWEKSNLKLMQLIKEYNVDLIGIGNGTASKETELLVVEVIADIDIPYIIVDESGASVYSASEEARREFGNLSVEKRSAISLARRIQNPLAELIKIDPKSLGVGQYQHIVNSDTLGEALSFVTISVVNKVGVDLNTASSMLLRHVSGLNEKLAENIIKYREENGKFTSRKELLKVKSLGKKTYEQCVGFLRIENGKNALDNTIIHPEQYEQVGHLLDELKLTLKDVGKFTEDEITSKLINTKFNDSEKELIKLALSKYTDIREINNIINFKRNMISIEDLKIGFKIEGIVRSVVAFGGFVDIGLKNDAFIHISQLANKFVKSPNDYISVGETYTFEIISIDLEKAKVSLSLK